MTYEEFLNFSGANPCPPPADAEEAIALPRGESEDVARLWVFRRRDGTYFGVQSNDEIADEKWLRYNGWID